MTNLSDLLPAGAASKQLSFTANGTITSGKPVVLNDNGTVTQVGTVTEALGSQTPFSSTTTTRIASCYDPDTGKTIIAYRGASNYGYIVVATPASDNSITFGTPVEFRDGTVNEVALSYDTGQDRVLLCYVDGSDGNSLKAITGTVSGTTISLSFNLIAEANSSEHIAVAYSPDSANHMLVYSDGGNSNRGAARVITISGAGAPSRTNPEVLYNGSNQVQSQDVVYDTTQDKFIVFYRDAGNSYYGECAVGSISGTTITFGTPVVLNSANTNDIALAFDSSSEKTVVLYKTGQDPRSRVISVSGTTPSAGSEVVIVSLSSSGYYDLVYESQAGKLIAIFDNEDDSEGEYAVGTVSGTSITYLTPVTFNSDGRARYNGSSFNASVNKIVLAFEDIGNSSYGTAQVLQVEGTNLTSTNFLGIADAAISNAASGNITMKGGVVTNSQLLPFAYTGSLGSAAVYQSTATEYQGIAFDSSNNKIVVAYKDDSNQHGTCAVGTVSGTSISWGTPVVFAAASTSYVDVTFDSSNNKVVIVYSDVANSEYGTAIVGTVSGTSISFGSEVVFASAATVYIKAGFDSNANKVVVAYSDNGNSSYGTAIVGTVSGTSISFGTEVVVDSTGSLSAAFGGFVFDSTNNKVVIPYSIAGGATYGIVGTVSGTSISFGTRVAIGSVSGQNLSVAFDSNAGKVVINYRDANNSDYTGSVVGTVSGTSISFGTELVIEEVHNLGATTFDSSDNKIIFFYKSSSLGYYRIGTVSGTSISYGSAVSLISNNLAYMAATFDSNQNTSVVVYKDTGNSNYGTAKGLQVSGSYPNLVPNTTYYVQDDGTLSTTSSSVTAGKAMSTNSINLDYST